MQAAIKQLMLVRHLIWINSFPDVINIVWTPISGIFRNRFPGITVKPPQTTEYTIEVTNQEDAKHRIRLPFMYCAIMQMFLYQIHFRQMVMEQMMFFIQEEQVYSTSKHSEYLTAWEKWFLKRLISMPTMFHQVGMAHLRGKIKSRCICLYN